VRATGSGKPGKKVEKRWGRVHLTARKERSRQMGGNRGEEVDKLSGWGVVEESWGDIKGEKGRNGYHPSGKGAGDGGVLLNAQAQLAGEGCRGVSSAKKKGKGKETREQAGRKVVAHWRACKPGKNV